MATYLPIMLDCEARLCLIVGGGVVAERKTLRLLEVKAEVTIIGPELTKGLQEIFEAGKIHWICRNFESGDTEGYSLVHATTDNESVNIQIAMEASVKGIPVNVASDATASTFMNTASMQRGRLTVAVSTEGAGPGVAVDICSLLEEQFGEEYEIYLDFLYRVRTEIKRVVASPKQRQRLLKKLTQCHILDDIQQGIYKEWSPADVLAWIENNEEE
ncbi:precorrin-2 dehydrogenase/sirohydrochlorin ferrochelatase [Paenibacillus sp. DS2015]|uniref:precorrin-2 dehydrogenase/sirohydrochlorin ferrochelatase family protein n=1 Tax=Paenibacillus sp. DS2015 TaxID=3373917 RepID=UPI003D1B1AE6